MRLAVRLLTLGAALGIGLALELMAEGSPVPTAAEASAETFTAIEGDFHMHTRFSDGVASPFDLVLLAERRGLRAIAVTEHNATFPAKLARWFAELRGSPVIVVIGEEVTSREAHLLVLGIDEVVDPRQTVREIAEDVHAQGGVVIAAHPVERFWAGLEGSCEVLDGVERMHPLAFRGPSSFGSWEDVKAFERRCREVKPLAVIGNSDFHVGPDFGEPRTVLFVKAMTESGVVEAIRERRTVVQDPDGTWHGEPEWTRRAVALERSKPTRTSSTATIALSLVAIALVGLAAFARADRAQTTPLT